MSLLREEAIQEACEIVALAYRSIGDYSRASDGFCQKCQDLHGGAWNYANQGGALEYVRRAVLDALKRDGYGVSGGFNPETGREVPAR